MTIKVGVIGTGQIAQKHLRQWRDIAEVEDVAVVAVCDLDQAARDKAAKEFGIADTYADFRDLIAREDVTAVDVCLHNNLHAPVSIAAMEAGKHVYCEKPIAGSYLDGVAMIEASKRTGKMLHIQLDTVFKPEVQAGKRLLEGGALGDLYHARVTCYRRRGRPFVDGYGTERFVQKQQSGGGALYDMGIYYIAQMLYLLGNPKVERVVGRTFQKTGMDAERAAKSGYDVEELGMGFVNLAGGIALDVVVSWAIHLGPFAGSYLVGNKGGIQLEPFSFHETRCDLDLDATVNLGAMEGRRHLMDPNAWAYDSSQQHWAAALQGKVPLLPTAELALNTMLIQQGIYLSEARGCELSAEDVIAASESTAVEL
jgi:predicted dehydrogenase